MLGVYCLNGKEGVFIMTDQGNYVGYLDLFTYVHFLVFACLMLLMGLNAKTSRYYFTVSFKFNNKVLFEMPQLQIQHRITKK